MNESCGCCEGLEPLTPLTTANRPGLDALAYRAGTHATFLETMKARLSAAEYPALRVLTTRAATDPSIALLDAWATVADVLTFYQERIANEGYLRTATERRSILELARLVGYVPRPSVAASVYLAFTLEDGYEVEIPAGARAQSLPGPGELPQFFETSEDLEARADWNILKPRLTRPQSLQPSTPQNGDSPPRRLYLKGVATNLEPNDPLLIDFGETQEFFKAHTVEPDPVANRTLVTLAPVVSPTDSVTGVRTEDIVRRVDRFLDPEAYEVSRVSQTAGRVVGLLEEWQDELTRETPPEELADSLRGRVLPQLQQDLDNARRHGHARLRPWIEQIVEELQEIEEELSAAASRGLARIPSAPVAATAPDVNGRSPAATLEELLERLAKPPSVPPVNAAKLSRRLETSFSSDSDAIPQLLTALRPDLGRALYQAWEQTGTEPSAVRVYALRTTASPFGHNAPPKPIIKANDTTTVDYEEWTLERATPGVEESYRISVGVDRQFYSDPDDLPELRIRLAVETEAGQLDEHEQTLALQPNELVLELEATDQRVRVNIDVEDVADGKRYTVVWDFLDRQTVVTISDRVFLIQIGIAAPNISGDMSGRRPEGGETVSAETTPPSAVQLDVEASYPDGGKEIRASGKMRRRSTEPTEKENVVSLDASYKQILPESWVVLERPNPVGTIPQMVITRGTEVREASRADYGITAKCTQITLRQPWLDLNLDGFTVIRGTSVHAGSELLEVAEAPPEVVDDDGVVKLEPVCGGQIELDALYDGLEPGCWLFVTGERDDLPGVTASELVMLAGVEQVVQQIRLTRKELLTQNSVARPITFSGRGSTGRGGYDLTISVRLLPDGSATGYAHLAGGAPGDVVQVDPPREDKDFWCINVRRTDTGPGSGDQRINWYIRDIGDGITTFDEIAFLTSIGEDCTRYPDQPGVWLTLTEGDFQASMDQPEDTVHSTLVLANDLAYCYKRETVRLYGNVVNATHGETRAEVLGSGDGSAAFQRFTLKQSPLTYVAATTPSGVESTLKVYVNDIRWHEAEHLAGLQRTDRRFITHANDQGEVAIVFGDGQRGARLPTGVENVRAVYRTGIGQAGNVAAEQISLLATRPLGLKGVINPLPASGGADRETHDQARRNAPLGVKVLDRLVSVRDHEDFARAFAGIGKASATRLSDGRQQLVHLTIAGADDIPIAESSDLYRHLLQALHRFGDPQQPIRVEVRELILLIISAGVRLMPDYLWESVESQIRASVLDAFSFERRELGQDALLSEAISTIQHVPGVSYVDVDTFGGIPEKTVDAESGLRRALIPSEIEVEIRKLVRSEDQPLQRITVNLAGSEGLSIHPAQLAFLTPKVPDTLILKEITA